MLFIGQIEYALNGKPQRCDVSWWPKPSAWESGGLWPGYWTPDCEKWFVNHRQKCREGNIALCSPTQWKSALRFDMSKSSWVGIRSKALALI